MYDAGVSSSPSVEPSWCVSPQGAWHAAWLYQCGRGCVGVVAPLCRILTSVPPQPHPTPPSSYTKPTSHAHTHTLFSCSITDTTYCLPPTGVNLSTVRRCQKKQSLPSLSCLLLVCNSFCVFHKKGKQSKLSRSVKYEYSVCFCAYVVVVYFHVCVCVCVWAAIACSQEV